MTNDFLFELGCEELPSAAVWPLANTLMTNMVAALDKAMIGYQAIQAFATPRRLGLLITALAMEAPSQRSQRRGPAKTAAFDADGNPTPALRGFAKSCGVAIEALTVSQTDKGEWLVYETVLQGVKTRNSLPTIITDAINNLPIAKPMRWGQSEQLFARPVHWAMMLLGNEPLACELFGIQTSQYTYGHRFHAPQALRIDSPSQYEALLHDAFVVADFAARRALIVKQIEALAKQHQACAVIPDELLDEVTAIVEWPQALVVPFDSAFLDVPAEALIAAMQVHQKCFALRNEAGDLLPYFITITNICSKNPEAVIAGNEKVMCARLSDAAFFFRQDKKQSLSSYIGTTAHVIFQTRLGTLLDKATRIQALMKQLAIWLTLDVTQAIRVAELCKCDLMTGMVGEFPELQGIMGYYYAQHDGEAAEVAVALKEQYLPVFAGDHLPVTPLGWAIALAERLDTVVGIFAIGLKPASDKDPFKLRRQALAIVRLLIANPTPLKLSELIATTQATYSSHVADTTAVAALQPFILERLQSYYQSQGISHDFVQAVKIKQSDWLYDVDKRIKALADFVTLPDAASLVAVSKRVNNLLQHAEQLHKQKTVDIILLQEPAEQLLYDKIVTTELAVLPYYNNGDYVAILRQLAGLRDVVDHFFDKVMVMAEDSTIKANRLLLLSRLQTLLQGVADISMLQLNL